MRSGNHNPGVSLGYIRPSGVCMIFFAMWLMLSVIPEASAFQNDKRNRIYISKDGLNDRKLDRKQKQDSLRKAQKAARSQKVKKPFKLGKPSFHAVLSGFRFLPEENAESDINFSAGLEVSFRPYKRLEVFAGLGLNYIDQSYEVDQGIVQGRLSNGALLRREHVSTDISVFGLEIPIGVRYRLMDSRNSIVIGFGLTSRTSFKEKYEDFINWQTGGSNGTMFIATTERATSIFFESPQSFEFFNAFSNGFLSLGKSFRVAEGRNAELQLTYNFNVAGVKNIFREVRFKKYESIGITLKYPLALDRWFK